jgi:hypothetical protein
MEWRIDAGREGGLIDRVGRGLFGQIVNYTCMSCLYGQYELDNFESAAHRTISATSTETES